MRANLSTKKAVSHAKAAVTLSAGNNKFRNDSELVEELEINFDTMEYAVNFIADVSNHIKSIELKVDPIIIRVNEFNEDSAKEFVDAMSRAQNTGQNVIPVIIDSYGGQVYSLMAMIGAIKSSRIPVATIVEGKAASCGAILFTFGANGMRYMDPDATLMIHDVSSMAWGKVEEMKVSTREAERLNDKVYKMMARNCEKPEKYFLDIIHQKGHADWYLDGDECMSHNLANHLKIPTFTCKVDLSFKLE
jgi:ATP-dependent Clp protease protease subunit